MLEVVQQFLVQNPVTEGAQSALLNKQFGLTFTTSDGIMSFQKTRDTEVSLALDGRRFVNWKEVMKSPVKKTKEEKIGEEN